MLHESAPIPLTVAHSDAHARFESRTATDRTLPSHGAIALASKPLPTPSSADARPDEIGLHLRAPQLHDFPPLPQRLSRSARTSWGVTGTGASLLSGALYSHGRSNYSRETLNYYHRNLETFQPDYAELPDHPSTQLDPEIQQKMDETRYIMLAIYAAGGTIAAESIILLTEESDDPTSTRAEIAPTWQNGGPAAYFRISF